jgi:two-component system, NtrC family, nitrogen regulation sensor histidine kinase GlnL
MSPAEIRSLIETLKLAAFDLAPDPALLLDEETHLIAANDAAEIQFGQSLALLSRGGLKSALPKGAPLLTLVARCAAGGGPVRERGLQIEVLGHAHFVADAAVLKLGPGALLLTLAHGHATPAAERAVEGLQSVAGLGRMLAHEIKNPLAGIRGAAQLLKTGLAAADLPLAQLIVDETERIRRLVDRMEVFAQGAAPAREPVNIHRVLDRVRALTANGVAEGLAIRERYDPSLPPAFAEEDQLIQIFLNLLKNAAEAAHARGDGAGEITIATAFRHGARARSEAGIPVQAAPLEIRVIDNGPGVPAAVRDHLFEPFVTTKDHGTGLGLALVAKLVAAHDGQVDFDSRPGRTEFRVMLPIAPQRLLERAL